MLKITLIAVGKLKDAFFRDACAEYGKRLSAYCRMEIAEIPAAVADESAGAAATAAAMEAEADRILARLPARSYVIPLCIEGKTVTSEQLAERFSALPTEGVSEICFIIGGSYGLSERVKQKGNERLSMSRMTFPHTLARVMLLEQIYRAFKINEGSSYHK